MHAGFIGKELIATDDEIGRATHGAESRHAAGIGAAIAFTHNRIIDIEDEMSGIALEPEEFERVEQSLLDENRIKLGQL